MNIELDYKRFERYIDTKIGIEISRKDGKNFLYKDGKEISLPNGILSLQNGIIFADETKIDLNYYIKKITE